MLLGRNVSIGLDVAILQGSELNSVRLGGLVLHGLFIIYPLS